MYPIIFDTFIPITYLRITDHKMFCVSDFFLISSCVPEMKNSLDLVHIC